MATMTMSELEMATATASSRQLKTPGEGLLTQRENPFTTTESSPEGSIKDDPVLEASRLADLEAPDGGRGWVVVAGCAVLTYWFMGTSYSWGVIQNALVEDDVGSAASLSFVGSVATAMVSAMALITAKISGLLGSRYTCMIGVVMLGLGEILAGFTTHAVGGLFATAGVVFGVGNGLCFMASSSIYLFTFLSDFLTHRTLVNQVIRPHLSPRPNGSPRSAVSPTELFLLLVV